jgi:Asp-tRNA(Asn)/Glu-tRNA(Gln) amidotransferase A subunit family amidase
MYLARIDAYDQRGPALNAISLTNGNALIEADARDAERRAGAPRPALHGIPVIVKDNYDTADLQTAAGSRALAGWVPPDEAFLVKKLRQAGAIIIAKSNMHEFAYGITTLGSLFGQTRNPYALDRNPGGSSGGTGAAIAANFAAVGMGSGTCGSVASRHRTAASWASRDAGPGQPQRDHSACQRRTSADRLPGHHRSRDRARRHRRL